MKRLTISLLVISFVFSVNLLSKEKISKEINTLVDKLKIIENMDEQNYIQKRSSILDGRAAPYAMIFEHTGLFEWQLFHECYYDWDVDTTTVIDVEVDYKPNDDCFSIIPAYFYFESKRPYSSLEDYKNFMVSVFQAVGTSVTVIIDESNSKYGYSGYHYCQSFYSSSTKLVLDCYFVYVDNIACAVYYMTGDTFYDNFLYQIFFDLILDVLEFKGSTGASEKKNTIPVRFNLSQNYPNPFNSSTNINYSVQTPSNIKLEIFNSKGCLIKTLINSYHEPGDYSINFDSEKLASGIYIYRLSNLNDFKVNRMILVK